MDYSVQVNADAQLAPAQITLHWVPDAATPKTYTVFRRAPGATAWDPGIQLPGSATSFVDRKVQPGTLYEYQIVKKSRNLTGYGYVASGIELPAVEHRGTLVLVVDDTHAAELAVELARLEQDLVGDGWRVSRIDVNRDDSVTHVKTLIKAQYAADPENVKAVFLFGHVPVPYSGNIVPDGHYREHEGAWPADGYYGDMEGLWTDTTVNTVIAANPRNHNVPGDGKFDQSDFPAPLKLMVGRVDLANMPGRLVPGGGSTFPEEVELLRNYLNKDHNYRHKILTAPERAVVGDYFGVRDGEAFAASGWRNFATFVGPQNITPLPHEGTWLPTLRTNAYLWAYACGSGSFTSIGGLGTFGEYRDGLTTELVEDNIKAVFTLLYGSWLGDWDSEDNLQRAVLATRDYGLTCSWSGRPHWFMHDMAMGEPIGYSALLTQNNGFTELYRNERNNCARWVHIALMGDPTLRMHVVAPPEDAAAMISGSSVTVSWRPSKDSSILGYNVYRSALRSGAFTRVNASPVQGTAFEDTDAAAGNFTYMVRALKRENSASGTYFNLSQGAFALPQPWQNVVALTNTAPEGAVPANAAALQIKSEPAAENAASASAERLTPTGSSDTRWVDDAVPPGAVADGSGGESWTWTANPAPQSGALAHTSVNAAGLHQHYFTSATQPMTVNSGDSLYAYVYIDPATVPSQLMLQWYDGSWEHRAYWGANQLWWGTEGTAASRNQGPVPAAGQWTRLEVPASQLGLEGRTVTGMAFTLFDGRVTWDNAGKSSTAIVTPPATNPPPASPTNSVPEEPTSSTPVVVTTNAAASSSTNPLLPGTLVVDNIGFQMPKPGDYALRVVNPTLLELKLINTKDPDPARVTQWDWVNDFQFSAPPLNAFAVSAGGKSISVQSIGFKRRPLYAPLVGYDLRIDNSLYLQLASPISDNQVVEVKNPSGSLWPASMNFTAKMDPLRYSPAIHVNQEGYMPGYSKKAMVGFYLGSMGEMDVTSASGFKLADARTGSTVYSGTLVQRPDSGYLTTPKPYQKVYEADFTSFSTPGEYRLVVPGLGASLPFNITAGIAMDFARTYALGLYHQRCGIANSLPYTRYTHDACHTGLASIPSSAEAFPFTWRTISNYTLQTFADHPVQTAPQLTSPAAQLFPFVRQGKIDVSGGHHDAGDYSKYTLNSVQLIHYLMFAVDSMPGVASLDNLGIPESGDGISDVLQEAKWESDFLAKMQDTDGGFYFLVYPENREYESDVTPDKGDAQLVWPKTSSATAASVAALAQCASSPAFKQAYPAVAAAYLEKARLGWQFLTNGIAKHGKNGIYQKITHYGDDFGDLDELAWAACEMYLATGDPQYRQTLEQWFPDPSNPSTFRWGWWRMYLYYGNAVRSYAFAARSGRLAANQLNSSYLAKCEATVVAAGDDLVNWSEQNAYGTSFPEATKRVGGAGWYFSGDQTFDLAVAYQVNPKPSFMTAMLANMNYEGGCNPVNVSYVTGLGWKRQRDAVSQYCANDRRILPSTGMPMGNIQWGFSYLDNYKSSLGALCFPNDNAPTSPYPFYDRWGDSWNVSTEFVAFQQARSLATYAFLAAQTPLKSQAWKPIQGQIVVPSGKITGPVTFTMQAPGIDLSGARIAWETRDGDPAMGQSYTFTPKINGSQWIEAEAQLPDGRRVFAVAEFVAETPNVTWIDDSLPAGAQASAEGGDSWTWSSSDPNPVSGTAAHLSASAAGIHQHFFRDATATMQVGTGAVLYAYVYVNPADPPREIMLQWNDGSSWEHRAYWGGNLIGYGTDGTASRRGMGALPASGNWVQLQIPAAQVGLEGKTVSGMAFTLFDGRAAWDAAGVLNPVAAGTNDSGTPVVTVAGVNGSRADGSPGKFKFTRSGSKTKSLTVNFDLGGTAANGVDYVVPESAPTLSIASLPANVEPRPSSVVVIPSVTIPAGESSAELTISPTLTNEMVTTKDVVLTLANGSSSYSVGAPGSATVVIGGNSVSSAVVAPGPSGPALTWPSTTGAAYRIAYKNNLADPAWTFLPGTIFATGNSTSWSDPEKQPQRFYSIIRVQ